MTHRSEPSTLHIEDMVVARAVFAALLRSHHELLPSPFEEKSILWIQAVHPRALQEGAGRHREGRGAMVRESKVSLVRLVDVVDLFTLDGGRKTRRDCIRD